LVKLWVNNSATIKKFPDVIHLQNLNDFEIYNNSEVFDMPKEIISENSNDAIIYLGNTTTIHNMTASIDMDLKYIAFWNGCNVYNFPETFYIRKTNDIYMKNVYIENAPKFFKTNGENSFLRIIDTTIKNFPKNPIYHNIDALALLDIDFVFNDDVSFPDLLNLYIDDYSAKKVFNYDTLAFLMNSPELYYIRIADPNVEKLPNTIKWKDIKEATKLTIILFKECYNLTELDDNFGDLDDYDDIEFYFEDCDFSDDYKDKIKNDILPNAHDDDRIHGIGS